MLGPPALKSATVVSVRLPVVAWAGGASSIAASSSTSVGNVPRSDPCQGCVMRILPWRGYAARLRAMNNRTRSQVNEQVPTEPAALAHTAHSWLSAS